tara:strand:- start:73 stop:1413 length:1341 start_codon:yes stop_codon:yes gene_type:complete
MADPVTSGINAISVGEGKDKKTIYTALKTTPTTDKDGNKTYKVEIVQYDNAKGDGERVIGEKTDGKINYNNEADKTITNNANAQKSIDNASKTQAKSIEKDLVTNSADSRAYHKANGNRNEGNEADNSQDEARVSGEGSNAVNSLAGAGTDVLNGGAGKAAAGTREKGFGSYVFPKSLRQGTDGQDFLKFDMLKYEPRDFDDKSFSFKKRTDTNKRTIGTVILPIPGGIQDGQNVGYGDSRMTPLDMAKANIALTTVSEGVTKGIEAAGSAAETVAGSFGDNKKALAAVIAGMAAGGQDLLTRTTGAIANPNMELLFNGPSLRTFSFQFLLAPRSQDEAKTIIQILRFFKQGMAPIRTKSRLFLKSPHTFQLSYRNSKGQDHKYLNKFKECALGTFGVNYTPNGNYSTYEDGVMTAYQMSMTFRELNPIYNDDYGNSGSLPAEIGF